MGLYDRDYTQADFHSQHSNYRYAPQMRMNWPKITPVVKWLLIINFGVFLAAIAIKPLGIFIYNWFQLDTTSPGRALQLWRLISYQFLHDPNWFMHISSSRSSNFPPLNPVVASLIVLYSHFIS